MPIASPSFLLLNVLQSSGIACTGIASFVSGNDGVLSGSFFFSASGTGTFQVQGVPIAQQSGVIAFVNGLNLTTSGLANLNNVQQRYAAVSGFVAGDPDYKLLRAAVIGIMQEVTLQLNAIRARVSGLAQLSGLTEIQVVKNNAIQNLLSGLAD